MKALFCEHEVNHEYFSTALEQMGYVTYCAISSSKRSSTCNQSRKEFGTSLCTSTSQVKIEYIIIIVILVNERMSKFETFQFIILVIGNSVTISLQCFFKKEEIQMLRDEMEVYH